MKGNRRNYYRILHVQPEAPPEIVTASYRAMMSKLRLHPDLGGDHESAVLVNQAYAVLSDPCRREQYDRILRQQRGRGHPQMRGTLATGMPARAAVARPAPAPSCRFCQSSVPAPVRSDTRCHCCDAPLAPPPAKPAGKYELFGRRSVPRVSKSDAVSLYAAWQTPPASARLHDLSVTGISVIAGIAIQANQVVRVVGPAFDVLACVICCHPCGRLHKFHARLLSAIFARRTGVFVSMLA
jgi:curved DNA-binding protein CbpA